MHISLIILELAGAVMLLLYSTRMVRTGFERAAGPALRSVLLSSSDGRFKSIVTGFLVAILLQSSTAVVILISGFVSTGAIAIGSALAIVLGADLGTAAVVQFLSFDLAWLIPVLLLTGGILFLRIEARTAKQIGRVVLGIALILISLKLIGEATAPLRSSSQLPAVVNYLSDDIMTAFIGGAALAFLFHSSVAAILLFATLCAQAVLPLEAGMAMVLGANVGGGVLAVWLTRKERQDARSVALANSLLRTIFGLMVLLLLGLLGTSPDLPGATPARQLVNLHLFFNLALVVISLPLLAAMLRLAQLLAPRDRPAADHTGRHLSALDASALHNPDRALASVTREVLRMSQLVEVMVAPVLELLVTLHADEVQRVRRMDVQVNAAHTDIKLYIAELNSGHLSVGQARRGIELTSMAINLERVGDIIAHDLLQRIEEKHERRWNFSKEGWHEISALHARVLANMQLALNVLVSEDLESARQLLVEKTRMGELARETRSRHLLRLMKGTSDSIATSDLHLEVVRALREINSLYTSVAYPILAKYGMLLDNRLAESSDHRP